MQPSRLRWPQVRGAKALLASLETTLLFYSGRCLHFSMTDCISSPLVTAITQAFFSSLVAYQCTSGLLFLGLSLCISFQYVYPLQMAGTLMLIHPCSTMFQSLPTADTFPKSVSPTHFVMASSALGWDPQPSGSWSLQTNHILLNTWKNKCFCSQHIIMELHPLVHTCASQMYPCVHTQNMSIKRVGFKTAQSFW